MHYGDHVAALNELSASESIFTTAQAALLNIPRNALSQAVNSGRAERITHGAYKLAGTPSNFTDTLSAIWKLTAPSKLTAERMSHWDGITIGGTTAASLLNIGDFYLSPYRIYSPTRINSRTKNTHFGKRIIEPVDVTWINGLPVTKIERTLIDLCLDDEDPSLIEDAFRDAFDRGIDIQHLEELIRQETSRTNSIRLQTLREIKTKCTPKEWQ